MRKAACHLLSRKRNLLKLIGGKMSANKCIHCGKNRAGKVFSKSVDIVKESVAVKNINEHWNLNRKFEISALICDTCLEKEIKKQKSSDAAFGIGWAVIFIVLLLMFIIISLTASMDSNAAWIMTIFILSSGFGSYYFLRRYFKLSDKDRGQREAKKIIENLKKDIVEKRKEKRLCELCGNKGGFEIRIYARTQYATPTMMDIPSLVFFRCRDHQPAHGEWDGEFQDLRAKSFRISVTEI